MIEISHLCNFMKFRGYHLCLALQMDSCYSASFTKDHPEMPRKWDGCGTYQAAIKKAAETVFEKDIQLAKLWAIESLKGLYLIRD